MSDEKKQEEIKAPQPRPLTQIEVLRIMVIETENEITKTKITERLAQREKLRGASFKNVPGGKVPMDSILMSLQTKIKDLNGTLKDLKDILEFELDEEKRKSNIKV